MLQFYVVDNLWQGTLSTAHFHCLPDAVQAYRALPAANRKALGVQRGVEAIDLVQCLPLFPDDREGEDVMVLRFLEYPLWKSDPQIMEAAQELASRLHIRYCLFRRCIIPAPERDKLPRPLRGRYLWPDEPGDFATAAQWIYVAGVGRLSALEFKRRYMDVNSVQYPLVVHIGAHGMDSRGNYKALQVTPWEFHLLARRSSSRAAHPSLPGDARKLTRSAAPPLPTGTASLGSRGGPKNARCPK